MIEAADLNTEWQKTTPTSVTEDHPFSFTGINSQLRFNIDL